MNAQNAAQYLPFVKALAEGKKIRVGGVIIDEINFDMRIEMYRIDEVPSRYRINAYTALTPPRGRGQPKKEATQQIRAFAADVPRLMRHGKTQSEAVRALLKIK